jgi:hypothetical protein
MRANLRSCGEGRDKTSGSDCFWVNGGVTQIQSAIISCARAPKRVICGGQKRQWWSRQLKRHSDTAAPSRMGRVLSKPQRPGSCNQSDIHVVPCETLRTLFSRGVHIYTDSHRRVKLPRIGTAKGTRARVSSGVSRVHGWWSTASRFARAGDTCF